MGRFVSQRVQVGTKPLGNVVHVQCTLGSSPQSVGLSGLLMTAPDYCRRSNFASPK